MEPVILFRNIPGDTEEEIEIARKYFRVEHLLTKCKDCLVIPRFSCLPYYKEFEENLRELGSAPINSWPQHNWIASFSWYETMVGLTPESWTEHEFPSVEYEGPFVVKGCTNSKKHRWSTHMFAATKKDAQSVASKLRNDMHLASQDIIFRKYVDLKTFEIGINGIRFANEWRFFLFREHILSYGYYWSGLDDLNLPYINDKAFTLIQECIKRIGASSKCNFYVLDIAETKNGDWILIEMNDASMSGLSENSPSTLYYNLRYMLEKQTTKSIS